MLERDGKKATKVGGCGYGGMDAECFLSIWDAADGGAIIQLFGTHFIVHRRRLDISGVESAMGAEKVGTDGKDIGERRVG